MKERALPVFLVVLISFSATAQSDSSFSKSSWFLSIHSGALLGNKGNGSSLSATVIQGVRYDRFSLGVGLGYDAYNEWRTLPVFVGLGYEFIKRGERSFFFQINTGYSKAWNPSSPLEQFFYSSEDGFFYHPFLGYSLKQEKITLYVTAGYKFQRLNYRRTSQWWGAAPVAKVEQDIERLSVQIGIGI